ncbi:IMPACT family protein [Lysobacter sp. GX 14042]|uniref:IMPACT family protein n=1 Tax=Lysobacter sp. GX 14042 TaxID=2907155 RepID=UPI001F3BA729|nr:YigZ family protein [Lysobacter sp. GX 14042]MCE7031632.1 IMPACT family protein [Lysobacter sp. GX 14042]
MSHQTLQAPARHELVVKHSRFLALAAPAGTSEEAMAFIAAAGTPEATHNCWAWRIGGLYRSSDDGEPAGTAGRPILAAIDGQGLDQAVVVVTRWYGGIKLGAGGLVRAYGGCAAECLRTAPRRELVEYLELQLAYPFAHTGAVHSALAQHGADKLAEDFAADGVELRLRLPSHAAGALRTQLRDATRDEVRVTGMCGGPDDGQ